MADDDALTNKTKRKLASGELVLCMGVNQMRSPNIALLAAAAGFDAIYIDLEHNPTSLESAAAISIAALGVGVTPIVRIASHHQHDATRILDSGAQGVMVPHVANAKEARVIVEHCRFPPHGRRSAAGTGPALLYRRMGQAEINAHLNQQTLLIAMIETPEAVEDAEAIAAVAGIDVVHIGSTDLSTEYGIPGNYTHPTMRAAYERVATACRAHGKAFGVGGVREDHAFQTELLRLGVRYLTCGSDVGYIVAAGRADVSGLRAIAERESLTKP